MDYLKFYNKNIKRLLIGGAFDSAITEELKQKMSLSDYIEAKKLENEYRGTLVGVTSSDESRQLAYKRMNAILGKYQAVPATDLFLSTLPTDEEINADIAARDLELLENNYVDLEERSKSAEASPVKLDSLLDYRQQGTVAFNTDNLKIDSKTGTLGGATITATNSDGTINTREIQGTKSGALKLGLTASQYGIIADAGINALNMIDNAVMGDKNFDAQSLAIDQGVHGVSKALLSTGNPYAFAAAGALEVANFMTKAGGQTVQGYDVDIKSSGYGDMGHKESSSSRDFGALIGLGGLNSASMDRKLAQRNQEAQMALKAANISDTIAFELESRMNSVLDTLEKNEIALLGGIDTSLLVAKNGAKLEKKVAWNDIIIETKPEVIKAQNGAKLENVEVSEEKNVIPEGALHKNKHDLDLEEITEKGIPVIHLTTTEDVNTLEEIKNSEGKIILDCEVEESEIIFNKELTDYIENARKKWHESEDLELALEVGKRLVKEILTNTDDNTDLITKMEELV